METKTVGAGILNIITESLYDKPIVVFREYVQNAVDSFFKSMGTAITKEDLFCKIWYENGNLYFLDNGNGIIENKFEDEMKHIAYSHKKRTLNMGYKGIGRLSGISYCEKLVFVNIVNYRDKKYQTYVIECQKYNDLKKRDDYGELGFDELMDKIGTFYDSYPNEEKLTQILGKHEKMFIKQNRGFFVMLEEISPVLRQTVLDERLVTDLGWLLPVEFKGEMYEIEQKGLFEDITQPNGEDVIPAIGFNILYNDMMIERPIDESMLRDYICKFDLEYAIGFLTFRRDKIIVEKGNGFSGIKMYIDNMLLCDETELIPMLLKYGLLEHTSNELLQTVNGIGAMIYITDKVSISANARRTFIEVTDSDALKFLEKIALFIEKIYKARYALSKYSSGKKNMEASSQKLDELKNLANEALVDLAAEEIVLPPEENETKREFTDLTETEKKQVIKKKLTKEVNEQIKLYLAQVTSFDFENAFEDFKIWLRSI
ncbi:ATP-binding protein [Blautia producta]|uniref:ATP-binding protein n=1 Tax=Blautia producta TaxID=33035 RepID=UPI00210AB42F|nr:ATP-binding protein [Blautia producta]MCQ4742934.1 ATP-binding protein [Blautia producta]